MKSGIMKGKEIRVTGVSAKVAQELKAIASNMGVSVSDLIKTKLHEVIDRYPPHLKIKKDLDKE